MILSVIMIVITILWQVVAAVEQLVRSVLGTVELTSLNDM